ncbi:hypothetical protein R1sor_018605 [Riccia sorocarpa]|uniref:RING-type domain-containing protein n=1 Tax=Riccia sorocarpa TaxID=122646 RepID=A0ABD3IA58_9MARC
MENIDRIVRAMEMEHTPRGQKRCRVDLLADDAVLDASNSALEIYRTREQALVPSPRTGIQFSSSSMNLEELSVLSKEEVAPFLNTKRVKADGIVYISSALFQPSGRSGPVKQWEFDISEDGLRKLMNFPVLGECRRIVSPVTIEKQFLDRTGHEFLKDAWKEIAPWFGFSLDRAQARSKGWVVDDFRKFSVEGHPDGNMLDRQVRLLIHQAQRAVGKISINFCSSTLLLLAVAHVDPTMADSRPDWHCWVSNEIRGKLGHAKTDKTSAKNYREGWNALVQIVKSDYLTKQAQSMQHPLLLEACNAFTDTRVEWDDVKGELVRERDALKEELVRAKELAAKAEEREETLRENKRNTAKEESVQADLAQIRHLMEDAAKSIADATQLKRSLEDKEQELRRVQDKDKKIRQRLKLAKKKGKELESELRKTPMGVIMKPGSLTLELIRSGKKWQIASYPQPFDCRDWSQWKKVAPETCSFCKGVISPGTDMKIPTCGHSYHISCVCSSFGLNYLVCWEAGCSETLPMSWLKEFCLDREVDVLALVERYCCSWDVRSMAPFKFEGDSEDDFGIFGVPAMRALKKEFLDELADELTEKTAKWWKGSRVALLDPPSYQVPGEQFLSWRCLHGGLEKRDWARLWGHPSTNYWIFSKRVAPHQTSLHSRCLLAVHVECPRSSSLLAALCRLNSALGIRMRPWDGFFLESFALALVAIPWAVQILQDLLEKKFVSVWRTRRVSVEDLQSRDSYKTLLQYQVLSPLFSQARVWECTHASTSAPQPDHKCLAAPQLPKDATLWLTVRP